MYYKIINKDSKIYQELFQLRQKEHKYEKSNKKLVEDKIGLEYNRYIGRSGQQNFYRVTNYNGFEFNNPELVCLKTWKKDKNYPEAFVPNKRTKEGKEMSKFLNGLEKSWYHNVFDILGIEHESTFTFPCIEIQDDILVLYLGESTPPQENEDLIEITSKEFKSLTNNK